MMKILITGGNGYIAKSLTAVLRNTHEVYAITRQQLDLTDSKAVNIWFEDKSFDAIVHTAVVGGSRFKSEDSTVMDQNLQMYYNLLAHKDKYDKFINLGSGAELFSEHTPYSLSKHIIRESILEKSKFYNIRIFGVFDENELDTRFIKSCIKKYINKEPMQIQNKRMSFFYMQDLITLIHHHIVTDSTLLISETSCAYMNSTHLLDIANIINELDYHKVPIYIDTQLGVDYESKLNVGYGLHYVGLKQGILNTYNKLKK